MGGQVGSWEGRWGLGRAGGGLGRAGGVLGKQVGALGEQVGGLGRADRVLGGQLGVSEGQVGAREGRWGLGHRHITTTCVLAGRQAGRYRAHFWSLCLSCFLDGCGTVSSSPRWAGQRMFLHSLRINSGLNAPPQ